MVESENEEEVEDQNLTIIADISKDVEDLTTLD